MQNDLERGEGSSKLVIPSNSQLYKIVGIHKNGFQLTLLNVGTGAKQEVVHSKVKALNLDALEDMCFATPELFDKLVQLRRKLRNTYEAGSKTSSHLYQIPFCEPLSNSSVVPGVDQNEGPEDGESDEVHEKEQVDEDDDENYRARPSFDHPVEEITHDKEDDEVVERPENTRITRYRGKKHVPVFALDLGKNKQLSEMPNKNTQNQNVTQSIINCKNYSKNNNYDIKLFRAEGKNYFYARKRALMAHILICEESFCEICNISKKSPYISIYS